MVWAHVLCTCMDKYILCFRDCIAFLVYRDRGLGRVSLTGYCRGILKLRMEYRGKLSSIVSCGCHLTACVLSHVTLCAVM